MKLTEPQYRQILRNCPICRQLFAFYVNLKDHVFRVNLNCSHKRACSKVIEEGGFKQ